MPVCAFDVGGQTPLLASLIARHSRRNAALSAKCLELPQRFRLDRPRWPTGPIEQREAQDSTARGNGAASPRWSCC